MAEKPITTMAGTVRGGVFSVCVCVCGVWCVPEEELRASRMLRVMSQNQIRKNLYTSGRCQRPSLCRLSGVHSTATHTSQGATSSCPGFGWFTRSISGSVTSQDQAERPDWKTCVRISRFAIKLSLPIKSRHLRPFIVITSNWFNRYSWSYEKPLNGSIRVSQDSTGYSSNRFPLPATLPSSLLVRGSLLAFVLGRLASSSGKEPEPLLHLQSVPRRRILHCGSTSQIVAVLLERELTRL